jgi:hypothetical protein
LYQTTSIKREFIMSLTHKKKTTTTCFGCWTNMDEDKAHQQHGGCIKIKTGDDVCDKHGDIMCEITCYGCIINDDISETTHEECGGCRNEVYMAMERRGNFVKGLICYGCKVDSTNEFSHMGVGGCCLEFCEEEEKEENGEKETCRGCLYDIPGQLAHMEKGGCLYE